MRCPANSCACCGVCRDAQVPRGTVNGAELGQGEPHEPSDLAADAHGAAEEASGRPPEAPDTSTQRPEEPTSRDD